MDWNVGITQTVGGGKKQEPTHSAQESQSRREHVMPTPAWTRGEEALGKFHKTGYSEKEVIPHQGIGAS